MNVCVGLAIQDRGTCLIARTNLGMCQIDEIATAMEDTAELLCNLHISWRKENPEAATLYRPLEDDRQIGVDVMGLANLLAREGVSFEVFDTALEDVVNANVNVDSYEMNNKYGKACDIVFDIDYGYSLIADKCDEIMDINGLPRLDRIVTIEPAQNHSFQTKDLSGFTTCRGIWAPVGRKEQRSSESQGNKIYNHGKVETASEVGAKIKMNIDRNWQRLMDDATGGRAHAISSDWWEACTVENFKEWIDSPLKTAYYQEHNNIDQSYLQKRAMTAVEDVVCANALFALNN